MKLKNLLEICIIVFVLAIVLVILLTIIETSSKPLTIEFTPETLWDSVVQIPLIFHAEGTVINTAITLHNAIDNLVKLGYIHLWFISYSSNDEVCLSSARIFDLIHFDKWFLKGEIFKNLQIEASCSTCLDVCSMRGIPKGWVDTLHIFHVNDYCECVNDIIYVLQNPILSSSNNSIFLEPHLNVYVPPVLKSSTPVKVSPVSNDEYLLNLRYQLVHELGLLPSVIRNSLFHSTPKILTSPNIPINGIFMDSRVPFPKLLADWKSNQRDELIIPDYSFALPFNISGQNIISLSNWGSNEQTFNLNDPFIASNNNITRYSYTALMKLPEQIDRCNSCEYIDHKLLPRSSLNITQSSFCAAKIKAEQTQEQFRRSLLNETILYSVPILTFESTPRSVLSPKEDIIEAMHDLEMSEASASIAAGIGISEFSTISSSVSDVTRFSSDHWISRIFRYLWGSWVRESYIMSSYYWMSELERSRKNLVDKELDRRLRLAEEFKKLSGAMGWSDAQFKPHTPDFHTEAFDDLHIIDREFNFAKDLHEESDAVHQNYRDIKKKRNSSPRPSKSRPIAIGVHLECCTTMLFTNDTANLSSCGCTSDHSHAHILSPAPQPLSPSNFDAQLAEMCPGILTFVTSLKKFVSETFGDDKVKVVLLPVDLPPHLKASRMNRIKSHGLLNVILQELSSVDIAFSMESHRKPRLPWWTLHTALGVLASPVSAGERGVEEKAKQWLKELLSTHSFDDLMRYKERSASVGKRLLRASYFMEILNYVSRTNTFLAPDGTAFLGRPSEQQPSSVIT